ncbi:MAG: hypothetical protein WCP39_07870, partial [Chlamydiota bacterium]
RRVAYALGFSRIAQNRYLTASLTSHANLSLSLTGKSGKQVTPKNPHELTNLPIFQVGSFQVCRRASVLCKTQ